MACQGVDLGGHEKFWGSEFIICLCSKLVLFAEFMCCSLVGHVEN